MVARNAVVILGATATGKTSCAVSIARRFGGEIISADSRQVYRGLDLGSGKDLAEYGEIPYHLVDIVSLPEEYSVYQFQRDFCRVFDEVQARRALPVIAGGTGMYLDSIVRGYTFRTVPENPDLRLELASFSLEALRERLLKNKRDIHNRTDLEIRERLIRAIEIAEAPQADEPLPIHLEPVILGIRFPRHELRSRIRIRLETRIEQGLLDEVASINDSGISWERLERLGLEYRFTAEYLQGKISSHDEYFRLLYTAICQFAKRQETWFRGMERKGVTINWIENGDLAAAVSLAETFF